MFRAWQFRISPCLSRSLSLPRHLHPSWVLSLLSSGPPQTLFPPPGAAAEPCPGLLKLTTGGSARFETRCHLCRGLLTVPALWAPVTLFLTPVSISIGAVSPRGAHDVIVGEARVNHKAVSGFVFILNTVFFFLSDERIRPGILNVSSPR